MSTKKDEKKAAKADKNEKNSKFALNLSELRRERGISQKKAATDLGISQALLSHYEKGIRECGLDFVIRCSEYYSVTTDYLLGVSESRNGFDVDAMNQQEEENGEFSVFTLGKATKYLLDLAATGSDEGALKYVSDYYTLCVYRGAITLAKAGLLPKEMFRLDYTLGRELASAALSVEDAKFVFIEDKSRTGSDLGEKTALHSLIEKAENIIYNTFVLE
jgi:transcriptional regulator with XRE-family HTH domain